MSAFILFTTCFISGIFFGMRWGDIFTGQQIAFILTTLSCLGLTLLTIHYILTPGPDLIKSKYGLKNPLALFLFGVVFFCFGIGRHQLEITISSNYHFSHFMDLIQRQSRANDDRTLNLDRITLVGSVNADPDLREDKTVLYFEPTKITFNRLEKGEITPVTEKVEGGLVYVTLKPSLGDYYKIAYGQTLSITGRLSSPIAPSNPGSFDFAAYLKNRGVFGCVFNVARDEELQILEGKTSGNQLYRLSLHLKQTFLEVLKQTMPFPESAFLGGVTLGLRYGLPQKITDDFKKTGVSHVLAVSGLHVSIIAIMFFVLFSMTSIDIRIFSPIIILFLFLFALLVGWPPSAVRATIMNSITLLFLAYLRDFGLRSSVLFSLAVSADYILLENPLMLLEPSFSLSFMAILSLALLTAPFEFILRKTLVGRGAILGIILVSGYFGAIAFNPFLATHPQFFVFTFSYYFVGFWVGYYLSLLEGPAHKVAFQFCNLPQWLRDFIASQFAILFGMMGPLSAVYFSRLSVSSPVANMIAIPLIGIIVQIGLLADIIGAYVPLVGTQLALVLNGGNYLLIKFFLGMANFFATLFPYPYIQQPTRLQLVFYYFLVAVLISFQPIYTYIKIRFRVVGIMFEKPLVRMRLLALFAVSLGLSYLTVGFLADSLTLKPEDFRMTVLDVGHGLAVHAEFPGGDILVDGGESISGPFATTQNTVFPYLMSRQRNHLKMMILSSPAHEHITAATFLVESFRIGLLVHPFPKIDSKLSFEEYLKMRHLEKARRGSALLPEEHQLYCKLAAAIEKYQPRILYCENSIAKSYGQLTVKVNNLGGHLATGFFINDKGYLVFSDHPSLDKLGVSPALFDFTGSIEAAVLPNHGLYLDNVKWVFQNLNPRSAIISGARPNRMGPVHFSRDYFLRFNVTEEQFLAKLSSLPFANRLASATGEALIEKCNDLLRNQTFFRDFRPFFDSLLAHPEIHKNPLFQELESLIKNPYKTADDHHLMNRVLFEFALNPLLLGIHSRDFTFRDETAKNYYKWLGNVSRYIKSLGVPLYHLNPPSPFENSGAVTLVLDRGFQFISQMVDHNIPAEAETETPPPPEEGEPQE